MITEKTLINPDVIKKDPRNLAYLFPSMSATAFKLRTDQYYHDYCLIRLEEVAKMSGKLIIPASCVHAKRRDPAKRIQLFRHAYYIRDLNDMTANEKRKYLEYVEEVETC